ncbi:hypothetical protein PPERSA_02995 [Pseudocohnilembus persalinus]|uniref:Uncharacterized protein n=1 Tax=Pseudocohnilembus persalinus TaxID=266149 RepID=A0A0V0QEX9_PSEPJ|nr:hypothetical protein PPERSA_02995 [Pseudocohnilembus persalinus]|eukprot:KRX00735.1 hypothetical protein PPERSA_02995 [Pseudocohnilembus persalinus]
MKNKYLPEKPNTIFYNNASYVLNKGQNDDNRYKNNDFYNKQEQILKYDLQTKNSPSQNQHNKYLTNQQKVYEYLQQDGSEVGLYQTDRNLNQREQKQNLPGRQKNYSSIQLNNGSLSNRSTIFDSESLQQKLILNQHKKLNIANKVTDGNSMVNMYNSAVLQDVRPFYENQNLRSVAQYCINKSDYNNIDKKLYQKVAALEDYEIGERKKLSKLNGHYFSSLPNRNLEKEKNNINVLVKEARNFALANDQDIDHMKNITYKLNNYLEKVKQIKDLKKAASYKKAVEKRIHSQIAPERKIKLTELLINDREKQQDKLRGKY